MNRLEGRGESQRKLVQATPSSSEKEKEMHPMAIALICSIVGLFAIGALVVVLQYKLASKKLDREAEK